MSGEISTRGSIEIALGSMYGPRTCIIVDLNLVGVSWTNQSDSSVMTCKRMYYEYELINI